MTQFAFRITFCPTPSQQTRRS